MESDSLYDTLSIILHRSMNRKYLDRYSANADFELSKVPYFNSWVVLMQKNILSEF